MSTVLEDQASININFDSDKYTCKVSLFVPVYNEEENLPLLQARIKETMPEDLSYEVIYVDDGSSDKSFNILEDLARENNNVKVIKFRRNYGQTPAMQAGIEAATGEILIPLDADMQNDPVDVVRLLEKIDEGYDVVSGWRKNRQDTFINRKLPSMIANKIISEISGVKIHDLGCSLKAYRADVIKEVKLYGELHRFIPICASWYGAKVTEIPVSHHPRRFGESKYGIERTLKVILDLIVIKFLSDYLTKPIYVFGSISLFTFALATISFIWALGLKIFAQVGLDNTPLPIIGAMFFTVAVQVFMMGLLADLLMRTYYESQNKRIYTIASRLNFQKD